jgi:hypothetical protein
MYNCGVCNKKGVNVKPALKYIELRADGSIAREDKICQSCHRGFLIRGYKPAVSDRHTIIALQNQPPVSQVPTTVESALLSESTVATAPQSAAPVSPAETITPIELPKLNAPDDYTPKPLTVSVTLPKPNADDSKNVDVIKVGRAVGKSTSLGKKAVVIKAPRADKTLAVKATQQAVEKKHKSKLKVIDKAKKSS